MVQQAVWVREAQLPPDDRSASLARDFVGDHLRRHDLHYLVHDVQLVVSELVTNSVLHARTAIDLTLEEDPFCVLLTVHDRSSAPPVVQAAGMSQPGGLGLVIVAGSSVDWGFDLDPRGGKSVWVMFALQAPPFGDWAAGA